MAAYSFDPNFTSLPAQNQEADKLDRPRLRYDILAIVLSLAAWLFGGCASSPYQAEVEVWPAASALAGVTSTRFPTPMASPGPDVMAVDTLRVPTPTVADTRPKLPVSPVPVPPTSSLTPSPSARGICSPIPARADRPSYRFEVEAEPLAHRLHVNQQLALADPLRLAQGELAFNVPANHEPGIFQLTGAWLAGQPEPLIVELSGTAMILYLPQAARQAAASNVCLEYTIELPPVRSAGLSAVHSLAWSELGEVAGYWYPVVAPYDPTSGWRLVPYHPVGDPILFEAADYQVTVAVPDGYLVIAPGAQVVGDGIWTFQLAAARGTAFVVSNQLVATRNMVDGMPVVVYHQPEYQEAALAVLRATSEVLPLFTRTYGPYPYDELVIVEAVQFGGSEYSALITLSSQWFADYLAPATDEAFGRHPLVRFAVHEIGHQWWYGGVGTDQAYEPWLDEALVRFGEWLYYFKLHPSHLSWWEAPSAQMATLPINQPIYNFSDTSSYVQAVYVSGTRFLLAVRDRMGAERFDAFLQTFYEQHRDRIVSQEEFLSALRNGMGSELDSLLALYVAPPP